MRSPILVAAVMEGSVTTVEIVVVVNANMVMPYAPLVFNEGGAENGVPTAGGCSSIARRKAIIVSTVIASYATTVSRVRSMQRRGSPANPVWKRRRMKKRMTMIQ
jgi:hypothetical protein